MARARIEVEIATLDLREQELSSKFFADSHGSSKLYLIANNKDTDECVVGTCDQHGYAAFKALFASAESIVRRLRTCKSIMPADEISNEMRLEIKAGELDLASVSTTCKLSIDRTKEVTVMLSFFDLDSDAFVSIRLPQSDYKRFKDWIRETDDVLDQLYADRKIPTRFLASDAS